MKLKISLGRIALAIAILATAIPAGAKDNSPAAQLHELNDQFNEAVTRHDANGILKLYADDTIWIEQGKSATSGLHEPRKLFEFVTANKGEVTHSVDTLFVSDDGTLAVMIGSVVAKMESVGMDATGTYLYVLKPTDDGWKDVTDMWHQHAKQN